MPIIELSNVIAGAYGQYRTAGAPVDGTSGSFADIAPIGALLTREDTGVLHRNSNTQASPIWTIITA